MNQTSSCAISTNTLHCALELSKNSWLLAIQFPDREQPSLYPIEGGNTEKLMAKLTAARDCWAKVSGSLPAITVCYEVGYDAFWLARFLMGRSIECLVIDPGSLQVNRRGRRVKTDRVDVKMLLRTLIAWCRGERHVWSLVRIPSIDEEDLRRSHRESAAGWCASGQPILTGSRDYYLAKAFGASTSNPNTRPWQSTIL
jgi:transposase